MNIQAYLDEVRSKFLTGQATEHSYRPALEGLFRSIDPSLQVINDLRTTLAGQYKAFKADLLPDLTTDEFADIYAETITYPRDPETFRNVSERGEQLRRLHLMELAEVGDTPYPYQGSGDDVIASSYPKWDGQRVYINKDQYFDCVPKMAWEFHIGGYQPGQKWLKDRRGCSLSYDDIRHYQRIIKILVETDRIMKEIALPLGDGDE